MLLKKYWFTIACLCSCLATHAQEIIFKDTIAAYNLQRLRIDKRGEIVQCVWGVAGIATGIVGYNAAAQDEWKYFHASNVALGALNLGYNGFRLIQTTHALKTAPDYREAYNNYVTAKRYYLYDAGFNLALITSGIIMYEYGTAGKTKHAGFTGVGRSFAIQGLFRLACDNILFAAHQRYNLKWINLLDEIRVTSGSIGIDHTIK